MLCSSASSSAQLPCAFAYVTEHGTFFTHRHGKKQPLTARTTGKPTPINVQDTSERGGSLPINVKRISATTPRYNPGRHRPQSHMDGTQNPSRRIILAKQSSQYRRTRSQTAIYRPEHIDYFIETRVAIVEEGRLS